ncbi:hypothetical protein PROFUN_15399 [Planoprotostelium fungivorum]|uniref:Uncharacterized protein n=1 Tax=Planoprotostelium fungivorum TaxID=1890364 RepID=A0A2P6MVE9_9EUKA|nr:hypothetical protein PROFUN_15399 [Planoprotostelium fungivorum]
MPTEADQLTLSRSIRGCQDTAFTPEYKTAANAKIPSLSAVVFDEWLDHATNSRWADLKRVIDSTQTAPTGEASMGLYGPQALARIAAALEDLILSRSAIELIKKSVFYFSENGSPIGVGFCVENQDTAVSAAHLWKVNNQPIIKCGDVVTGYFAPPYDGETIELRVDAVDFRLDVIKFQVIRRSSTATEAFLPVHHRVLEFGTQCVLVAFQIGMEREMKDINPNTTMGIVEGSVWKIHPRHLSYSCPSFDGDSGGALILRSGEVVGIHVESISQWRARTAADRSDPNFEDDLCDSIDSLSAGLAYGAIALRLQNII